MKSNINIYLEHLKNVLDLDNKYSKTILNLCKKRLLNPSTEEYTEKHHMLPRCICLKLGMKDNKQEANNPLNILVLNEREHFIMHMCLSKAAKKEYKGSLWLAASKMRQNNQGQKRYFNSRLYDIIRKELSEISIAGNIERALKRKPSNEILFFIRCLRRGGLSIKEVCIVTNDIFNTKFKFGFIRKFVLDIKGVHGSKGKPSPMKDKKHSKETIEFYKKIRAGKGNGMYGRKHTIQSIEKQKQTKKQKLNQLH